MKIKIMNKTTQQNYLNNRGNHQFSIGTNVKTNEVQEGSIDEIIKEIKSHTYLKNLIDVLRFTEDKDEQEKLKMTLPYFIAATFSGSRVGKNLIQSQHIIIDVDHIEEMEDVESVTALKEKIIQDKRTMACFVSPRGNGLKVLFALSEPITNPQLYTNVYEHYQEWFEEEFGAKADKQTTDVTRACYFSHDSDIYYNKNAEVLDVGLVSGTNSQEKAYIPNTYNHPTTTNDKDLQKIIYAVDYLSTRITDYEEWSKAGLALATLGEGGRAHFQKLSSDPRWGDTPSEVDKRFDGLLKHLDGEIVSEKKGISIATLFDLGKNKGHILGCSPEQQKEREEIIVLRKMFEGDLKSGKKKLYEEEGEEALGYLTDERKYNPLQKFITKTLILQ
jgi:hypothetical protein